MKWQLILITMLLMFPLATALIDCEGPTITKGELPCLIISSYQYENDCNTHNIRIYTDNGSFIKIETMGDWGASKRCNITFGDADNETELGSYLFNFSSGESAKIIIKEDNNMLIALVIGVSLIVALFIFLTFAVKEDKPFLANFFFLGIFIFTTVLSFLLWKITAVNSAPYEPVMLIVYRIFLIVTMLMVLIVLVMLTVEAVKIRKIADNPVDHFRDNLKGNEKSKF